MDDFLGNHAGVGFMGVGSLATAAPGIPANGLTLGGEELTYTAETLTLEDS